MRLACVAVLLLGGSLAYADLPKNPVPGPKAVAEAETLLQEAFADDFKNLKTAEDRKQFALKLADLANKTINDPTARYVMLRTAAAQGADAGEVAIVQDVMSKLATQYSLDSDQEFADVWKQMIKKGRSRDVFITIAEDALARSDHAAADGNFSAAKQLAAVALDAGRRAKEPGILRRASDRNKKLAAEADSWAANQSAEETLKKNPNDRVAHSIVGCFLGNQDQWVKAFPHLTKSDDAAIADLASKSVSPPAAPSGKLALADAWWKAAENAKKEKDWYKSAAIFWYQQALPGLTGLAKVKAEGRIGNAGQPAKSNERRTYSSSPQPLDERMFAEAMLKIGAGVSVTTGSEEHDVHPAAGTSKYLKQAKSELPAVPFHITRVLFIQMNKTPPDALLECLPSIPLLRTVIMDGATNEHVRYISRSQTVENVMLSGPLLTDECLQYLRGRSLDRLLLRHSKISDAGIPDLMTMQIRNLDLTDTQVTDAGVKKFQAASPNTKITLK